MTGDAFKDNVRLAWDLARRDLAAKHKRSIMGPAWLVLTPLCLLVIYTIVFGRIFGVSWQMPVHAGMAQDAGFVLPFFVGLTIYLIVSDVVNSSAVLFVSKRTFVVKSPFPIWVLWISNLFRASVHGVILGLLVVGLALAQGRLSLPGLAGAVVGVLLCLVFITGLSLLLAALGPFIGDISEAMRLLLRVLFYATPITYPLALVPEAFRGWMWMNPLTSMVELLREPIVFGNMPPVGVMAGFMAASLVLLALSAWVFSRVKGVVADVV